MAFDSSFSGFLYRNRLGHDEKIPLHSKASQEKEADSLPGGSRRWDWPGGISANSADKATYI